MFKLAKALVQHKIGVIAVIAFSVVMFANDGPDDDAAPASPWSKQAPVQASAPKPDEDSITGKLGNVANAAGEYAAETFLGDKNLNPVKLGEDAVGNFDKANESFAKANGNR